MRRCLIVDDSSVIRKVARHFVEGLRYEAVEAETGHEAIERMRADRPDVVILDWLLVNMTGLEVLSAMRPLMASGFRPHIVYLMSENDPAEAAKATAAGASAILLKPFDRVTFEARLRDVPVAA